MFLKHFVVAVHSMGMYVCCVMMCVHDRFYRRYWELRAKINAGNSCPALHASPVAPSNSASLPIRSASLKEKHFTR